MDTYGTCSRAVTAIRREDGNLLAPKSEQLKSADPHAAEEGVVITVMDAIPQNIRAPLIA